jgi:hypothetical protein
MHMDVTRTNAYSYQNKFISKKTDSTIYGINLEADASDHCTIIIYSCGYGL